MSALHNLSRSNNYNLLEKLLNNYKLNDSKSENNLQQSSENKDKLLENEVTEDKDTSVEGDKKEEGSSLVSKTEEVGETGQSNRSSYKVDSSFVDKRDSFNRTPLHLASYEGHLEVVKLLIKYGANVQAQAKNGMTSLHFACQKGHLEVVKYLCKHGAKFNSQTNSCMTPLHFAIGNEKVDCALFLINKGVRQKYNKKGQLPLELASESVMKKLKEELKDRFEKFEKDVPEKRVIHKETVKFYKKRKKE